jgi:glycosyltransferase involved in cell wall biosynthesis
MRICKVFDADYPWDVRVEKIARTLVENGNHVHLISRNCERRPAYELRDSIHVHRLPVLFPASLNSRLSFPAFFNPLWIRHISRVVEQQSADVIMVRDLPLVLSAVSAGRRHRVPVLFDMAEDYPAMIRDIWRFEGGKFRNLVMRNPWAVKQVERLSVHRVDGILTVVEESKARLVDQYGIRPDRISIVSNTPVLPADGAPRQGQIERVENERVKLVYVGGLQEGRSLDVVIAGIRQVSHTVDCSLTVLGSGHSEPELRRMASELGIESRVHFEGFVDHAAIGEFIASSDVGLVPHAATDHTNTTIPNKVFDYMWHGLPVLASNTRPVQRIVETEGCGLTYRWDRPEDFAATLPKLADSEVRRRMGEKGRNAVERTYNWGADAKRLLAVLAQWA